MPIRKNNSTGEIQYTAPADLDLFLENGVVDATGFAITDHVDKVKQIQFDPSSQATNTTVTIKSGANSGNITLTLPASSGTISTQSGLTSVSSTDGSISATLGGGGTTLDLQLDSPINWLRKKPVFFDDMFGTILLTEWVASVSGAGTGYGPVFNTPSITNGHPGVVKFTVGNSASARYGIITEQRQISFDTSVGQHTFEALIKLEQTPTASDDFIVTIGFADNYTKSQIAQGAYFILDRANSTSATNWVCKTLNGSGSATEVDSGTAPSTNWVRLTVVVNTAGEAKYYINGVLKATISTNLPPSSAPTNLAINIENVASTTTHGLYVDYAYWEPLLTTAR